MGRSEVVIGLGNHTFGGIVLDTDNEYMYWISPESGLRRTNLDGSGDVPLVDGNLCNNYGLAAHFQLGYLFWSNGNEILRCGLNGSEIETIVADTGTVIHDIAVDADRLRIIWSAFNDFELRSARFDGTDNQLLAATGSRSPGELEIDPDEGRIYFSAFGDICSVTLDGDDLTCQFYSGGHVAPALGVALDTGRQERALPSMGALGLVIAATLVAITAAFALHRPTPSGSLR